MQVFGNGAAAILPISSARADDPKLSQSRAVVIDGDILLRAHSRIRYQRNRAKCDRERIDRKCTG
jgi:hypothetical protein